MDSHVLTRRSERGLCLRRPSSEQYADTPELVRESMRRVLQAHQGLRVMQQEVDNRTITLFDSQTILQFESDFRSRRVFLSRRRSMHLRSSDSGQKASVVFFPLKVGCPNGLAEVLSNSFRSRYNVCRGSLRRAQDLSKKHCSQAGQTMRRRSRPKLQAVPAKP